MFVGRVAIIPYTWAAVWASLAVYMYHEELMPLDGGNLMVLAYESLIMTIVAGIFGIVAASMRNTKAMLVSSLLSGASVVVAIVYIWMFRNRVYDNFANAVRLSVDPNFVYDDYDEWQKVKLKTMTFGTGILASSSQLNATVATVKAHYLRYIVEWSNSVMDAFAYTSCFFVLVALAFTLYLKVEVERDTTKPAVANDEDIVVTTV